MSKSNASPLDETPSVFFSGLMKLVIHYPWVVLFITTSLTLTAFPIIINKIKVDNSLEMFTPPDSEAVRFRDQYRDLFGRDDLFMISARGDVFTTNFLTKLKELEKEVKAIDIPIETLGFRKTKVNQVNVNSTDTASFLE